MQTTVLSDRSPAAQRAGRIENLVARFPATQAALFPVRRDRSPYSAPQRRLLVGLYRGVDQTDPRTLSFNIVPGGGEIFQQPFLADPGVVAAILVEAIPGGPLEPITQTDPAGAPDGFVAALLRTIEEYAPNLAARIDPARFSPLGELDVLRGAVTPAVRRGWANLPDGRVALALGDAWIVNDPVTGQGADIGSHCAWHTAGALATSDRVDATFAQRLEDELWSFAGPVTGMAQRLPAAAAPAHRRPARGRHRPPVRG